MTIQGSAKLTAIVAMIALSAATGNLWPLGSDLVTRPAFAEGAAGFATAATAAQLAATPTAGKAAVLRLGYYAPGDAAPVLYTPLIGTCGANGLSNDGGGCLDTAANDGNAWKGQLGAVIGFEQFGARGDGRSDDSSAINAAIVYQCANLSGELRPRLNATYAIAQPIVDSCGAKIVADTTPIAVWRHAIAEAPQAPFIVKWVGGGRSAPFYMADIGPAAGSRTRIYNGTWNGVLWDCGGASGCGGALVRSVAKGRYNMGAWEPRSAIVRARPSPAGGNVLNLASSSGLAPGMAVTQQSTYVVQKPGNCPRGNGCPGSSVLPLTTTAGLVPGMVVFSGLIPANTRIQRVGTGAVMLTQPIGPVGFKGDETVGFGRLPPGTQIWSVDGASRVSLTALIQADFLGGESVGLGGEGFRFDVTHDLLEVNDTQDNVISLTVRNASGTALDGPGIVLGAVNIPGHGSGGNHDHYGNFSGNDVPFLECSYIFRGNACVVFGDQDHNKYGFINAAPSAGVVATGQLGAYREIGGPARFFSVDCLSGNFAFEGTELGFAAPAVPLGIDLPQISQAGAFAGVTAAALGAGNRGIRWRIDTSGEMLSK